MIESSRVQENHRVLGLPQCAACFNTDNPVVKMSSLMAQSSKLRASSFQVCLVLVCVAYDARTDVR